MADDERRLEFEIEVVGTPEEVWQAVATGPGISSWYVPHDVEERTGGAAQARFGPAPEMHIDGRVAAWEPPRRIVFDGGEGAGGLAFEWLVEAREGGTCIVRLINSGFGSGADWDAQYDGMADGWPLFLTNLQLHLAHFRGRTATAVLPSAMWSGARADVWARLLGELCLPAAPQVGDAVSTEGSGAPQLRGTVVDAHPNRLAILLDDPVPGTAFVAAEGVGEHTGVSVWSYLYDDTGRATARRDEPAWFAWLATRGDAPVTS